MALPIALPWAAPAIGEGLLWGAGALGAGLAAAGIIDNKDAIREGVSDFGNWVGDKVGSGIRAWSDAMSPKGLAGPNPHYDARTGRPIAVTDAIPAPRVFIAPSIMAGRVVVPTQYQTRFDSDGEPIPFPWQSGSPEKPIQLRPVTVTGSRVMRTDSGAAQPAQPEPTSTEGSGASPAPANPEPDNSNDSNNSGNQRRPSLRERIGDRIAGRNTEGQSTSGRGASGRGTTPPDNQQGSFLGRMLWETKNNNFGQNWWQWRNVGRVGLGASYPAREHLWPAVGQGLRYMTVGPDSVPATVAPQAPATAPAAPVDSSYLAPQQIIAPTDTLDF